jgi:hypothetical protein
MRLELYQQETERLVCAGNRPTQLGSYGALGGSPLPLGSGL